LDKSVSQRTGEEVSEVEVGLGQLFQGLFKVPIIEGKVCWYKPGSSDQIAIWSDLSVEAPLPLTLREEVFVHACPLTDC
jgi:hypothetical protein